MSAVMHQLHVDHINVAKLLDVLERQLAALRRDEDADYGLLVDIMLYMTQYPDLYHHPKEDLVFERLLLRDSKTHPAVQELMREHRQLAKESLQFLESLRGVENDVMLDRAEVISQGERYVNRLRRHMDKEEGELFPKAKQTLRAEDWEIIEIQMAPREDPLFGGLVGQQYQKRYAQLMSLIGQG